ncbi:MAG: hypothetical protein WED07_01200 [Candidatus Freyarchaeum deiterrae]
MKNEERAEEKRKEIVDILNDALKNHITQYMKDNSNLRIEDISSRITNNFVRITSPESDDKIYLITERMMGRGGGRSVKPGNIFLNWKKLIVVLSESFLTIFGAIQMPLLIPFACLVVWDKLYSLSNIPISEKHAAVIYVMWKNRDEKQCIREDLILNYINTELSKFNLPTMSQEELNQILKDLEKMKSIEKSKSDRNKWWLREWVRVEY